MGVFQAGHQWQKGVSIKGKRCPLDSTSNWDSISLDAT